ncbi:hypothetical protein [Hydrogenibacillus sp. N12]|uniref:hypothetical protein n=1 Tax=Hydrogenibacillus sp. N12 TaxID=2866627 RepID=UPI001C7D9E63|nr:hypothetical protein [Hydrogenibacillus sp. N12]QZA34060.1 hypothetical protein K2M58_06115 [Hydrogenibacillus sp. N12]
MAERGWGAFLLGAGLGLVAGALSQQFGQVAGGAVQQGRQMLARASRALGTGANELAEIAEEMAARATPTLREKAGAKAAGSTSAADALRPDAAADAGLGNLLDR